VGGPGFEQGQARRERTGELGSASAHLVAMTEAKEQQRVDLLPTSPAAPQSRQQRGPGSSKSTFSVELAAARPL